MLMREDELKGLNKSQLLKLARYYGVEKAYKMLKKELMRALLDIVQPKSVEPEMSVRVRRIKESQT